MRDEWIQRSAGMGPGEWVGHADCAEDVGVVFGYGLRREIEEYEMVVVMCGNNAGDHDRGRV